MADEPEDDGRPQLPRKWRAYDDEPALVRA